jgi:hypothetical protein
MGQDERRLAAEGAEHLDRGLVLEVIEAAAEGLAIQGHDAPAGWPGGMTQLGGMTAEGGLELGRIESVEEVA